MASQQEEDLISFASDSDDDTSTKTLRPDPPALTSGDTVAATDGGDAPTPRLPTARSTGPAASLAEGEGVSDFDAGYQMFARHTGEQEDTATGTTTAEASTDVEQSSTFDLDAVYAQAIEDAIREPFPALFREYERDLAAEDTGSTADAADDEHSSVELGPDSPVTVVGPAEDLDLSAVVEGQTPTPTAVDLSEAGATRGGFDLRAAALAMNDDEKGGGGREPADEDAAHATDTGPADVDLDPATLFEAPTPPVGGFVGAGETSRLALGGFELRPAPPTNRNRGGGEGLDGVNDTTGYAAAATQADENARLRDQVEQLLLERDTLTAQVLSLEDALHRAEEEGWAERIAATRQADETGRELAALRTEAGVKTRAIWQLEQANAALQNEVGRLRRRDFEMTDRNDQLTDRNDRLVAQVAALSIKVLKPTEDKSVLPGFGRVDAEKALRRKRVEVMRRSRLKEEEEKTKMQGGSGEPVPGAGEGQIASREGELDSTAEPAGHKENLEDKGKAISPGGPMPSSQSFGRSYGRVRNAGGCLQQNENDEPALPPWAWNYDPLAGEDTYSASPPRKKHEAPPSGAQDDPRAGEETSPPDTEEEIF